MTQSQRITIKLSEIRSKLMDLSKKEVPTDEDRAAIVQAETDLSNSEIQLRAALKGEADATPSDGGENRALDRLVDKASIGSIFSAVVEHRQTSGAEAELQSHFGLGAAQIPLSLLEERAVAVIPPDTSHSPTLTSQARVLQPAFAIGDASFLGVPSPRVPAGSASYPVLGTRPTVGGPHADDTSVAESTATFSASLLEPGRVQCGFSFRRSDAARFGPGLDESLRMALQSGLSEALDAKVVARIILDVSRTDATATATHTSYLSDLAFGQVDGRHIAGENEIRILLGSDSLVNASTLYRNTSTGERSALEVLRDITAGVRVSAIFRQRPAA